MDSLTLPGTPDSLDSIREYVRIAASEAGLDGETSNGLILALDDIGNEIFAHGIAPRSETAPPNIFVKATRNRGSLVIELASGGKNHRLIARLRSSGERRKLETLLTIAESLGREIQLDVLLSLIAAEVTAAMQAERSTLFLVDRNNPDELVSRVAEGSGEIRVRFGVGIAGATAQSRKTINVPDAYRDSRFNPAFDKASGFHTRTILSTPIMDQNGSLIGVVQVLNKDSGAVFTMEDERFLDSICVHLAIALQRAEMVEAYLQTRIVAKSLELAREIQMGLVPNEFPALPQFEEVDIFASIIPALDVGGDLYDFFPLDQDRICFMIGDVSGKGVPAALFMAMARTAFKMSAIAASASITCAMRRVNQALCESNPQHVFVTAFAGILDLQTGRVDYVDAGHEPPLIRAADGTVRKLDKVGNIVLGLWPDYEYTPGVLELIPGDNVVLFTDGVTEAMNALGESFGAEATESALCQIEPSAGSKNHVEVLVEAVRAHAGHAHQSDDITILAIRYLGPGYRQ